MAIVTLIGNDQEIVKMFNAANATEYKAEGKLDLLLYKNTGISRIDSNTDADTTMQRLSDAGVIVSIEACLRPDGNNGQRTLHNELVARMPQP